MISVAAGPSVTTRTSEAVFFFELLAAPKVKPVKRLKASSKVSIFFSVFIVDNIIKKRGYCNYRLPRRPAGSS